MFIPAYLQQSRHGVWYLRWPIPKALHPARKHSTVKVSLRTRNPKKALRLSRSISHMADMVIEVGAKRGSDPVEAGYQIFRNFLKRQETVDALFVTSLY